jgi:hypothetical protein
VVRTFTCLIFGEHGLPSTTSHIVARDPARARELAERAFRNAKAAAVELWEGATLLWSEPPGEEF